MKIIIYSCIVLNFILVGCSTRNYYSKKTYIKPPLVPSYVKMTRNSVEDAGVEPVEMGEVLVTNDTVYVANQTIGIQAFERFNFSQKWNFKIKNGVSSKFLLEDDKLYFGAEDGNFYSIDPDSGRLIWKYDTRAPIYSKPTTLGDKIYITAADDSIYCLDKNNGKWIWHYKRSGNYITTIRGNSTPAIFENTVIVGFSDGYLVALKAQDGNITWETKVNSGSKFTDVDSMPVVDKGKIYIPSYDGGLYVLEAKTGKLHWRVDIGGTRDVLIDDKSIYLASSNGFVYSLNKESGKILWKFELDRGVPTGMVLYQNYLAFGSSQEYFYVIYKGDGSIAYRHDIGMRSGFISNPFQSKNEIYAMSAGGNIYQYKWRTAYNDTYYQYQ